MVGKTIRISLGKLDPISALEGLELLAEPVAAAISAGSFADAVAVVEIDPSLSDTASFCAQYQVAPKRTVNCVIVKAKRSGRSWFAACVVLANTRADINGVVRRTLDARKVSFASVEEAVSLTNMEFGAITPLGLPADWPIMIDAAIAEMDYVVVGSGIRKSKIVVSGKLLAHLSGSQVIAGLGQVMSAVT